MFMDIPGIDLFDQNVGTACAKFRLFMAINGIDLFHQNVGMVFPEGIA